MIKKVIALLITILMILSFVTSVNAEISYTNWMSSLNDSLPLRAISIPVSHDSICWEDNLFPQDCSCFVSWLVAWTRIFAVTQNNPTDGYSNGLEQQWDQGIRGYDFRTFWNSSSNEIGLAHGNINLPGFKYGSIIPFKVAFQTVVDELKKHPTEFMVNRVAIE